MKSIYEASVAYGREHQGTVNIEDFEAGANYVLEYLGHEIELNESTFVYSREKYIKVQVLNKFIEQLKK